MFVFIFRTSPMSIQPPNNSSTSGNIHRQRQESTSSISVGSWQMISGTGSLRSQDSNIIVINEQTSTNQCNNNNFNNIFNNQQPPHVNYHQAASGGSSMAANGPSTDSTCTIVDDDCFTANDYFL